MTAFDLADADKGMLLILLALLVVFIVGCIIEHRASKRFEQSARQFFGDDWDK